MALYKISKFIQSMSIYLLYKKHANSQSPLQLLIIYYKKLKLSYNLIIIKPQKQQMSSQTQEHQVNDLEQKKKRRGESKYSKETPKYQCYCQKLYLSYPALYLHLKNKHPECFLNNRKIQVTKFKESTSSDGFKILKMEKQKAETFRTNDQHHGQERLKPPQIQNYQYQSPQNQYIYPKSQSFMMPPTMQNMQNMQSMQNMMSKNSFSGAQNQLFPRSGMQGMFPPQMGQIQKQRSFNNQNTKSLYFNNSPKFINQSVNNNSKSQHNFHNIQACNIFTLINAYFSQNQQISKYDRKQVLELQLIFSLLMKCIKEKEQIIKEKYSHLIESSENILLSSNYQYLESILPYFLNQYLNDIVEHFKIGGVQNQNQSNQERWERALIKSNKLIRNIEKAKQEMQKFGQWLISNQIITKISNEVPEF